MGEVGSLVRPQDDLWGAVNEQWRLSDPIPADRSRWGVSDEKRAVISDQLTELVTAASLTAESAAERTIAALFEVCTDDERRNRLGLTPVEDALAAVRSAATTADVLRVWGDLQRHGVTGPFRLHVLPAHDDATTWSLHLFQAGVTLPAPGMYSRLGEPLTELARTMWDAAGLTGDVTRALGVERALVEAGWQNPQGDSEQALHHPMTWGGVIDLAGVDLTPYAEGLQFDPTGLPVNVCQPSYVTVLGYLLRDTPVEDWQAFLAWRVLAAWGPYLHDDLARPHQLFVDLTLAGQTEPTPAARRAVATVQDLVPMSLAHAWVDRHFDPARRDLARTLAEALRAQLRATFGRCQWLSPASRQRCVDKLDEVVFNIGWPDPWLTNDALDVGDSLVATVRRCRARAHDDLVQRLDRPVDREVWGPPPFTVNTFYHPFYNQLTVEAGSLPPLDAADDPAVLYGQYGSIIGHELGHAFDTRGSHRDGHGRLVEQWTPDERDEFTRRTDHVIGQVHGYTPHGVDDAHVDGARVGFECIAELIGYQLAWDAYESATTPEERARVVDGATGAQRFFLAKAYGRRGTDRPQTARNRLTADPHPPFEVFTNLARNLDAFHTTFTTRPDDDMWLAPENRITIF